MKDDRVYLENIRDSIARISTYTAAGRDEFLRSPLIQDAVIRNFEIIGEAAKRLTEETKSRYPKIPWRRIGGFRNVLVHDYMRVDLEQVWNVITDHLPALKAAVERTLG